GGAARRGFGQRPGGPSGRGGSVTTITRVVSTSSSSVTVTTTNVKPQPRRPPSTANRSSDEESDDDDDGSDDDDDEDVVPPTTDPSTFWDPTVVFHCPLPRCPPETEPTMNPALVLAHLEAAHGVTIRNQAHVMPYLDRYIDVWAGRIKDGKVAALVDTRADAAKLELVLGEPGPDFEEDQLLRQRLQREKLNEKLRIQERERLDDASLPRKCLFCKHVAPSRTTLFKHMFGEHGFNIGLPDNLVEVHEFLGLLAEKMNNLQCLYCEKHFKSPTVLRKHMRKKKHFKISSRNHSYDRFYVINYLEPGKNWESFEQEKYESDEERDGGVVNEWEDWRDDAGEDGEGNTGSDGYEGKTMCLFDEEMFGTPGEAVEHLKLRHKFDLVTIEKELGLDFYGRIRLINHIRRRTLSLDCCNCSRSFESMAELTAHLDENGHALKDLPGKGAELWSDAKLLFPTVEDDPLLTWMEDGGEEDEVRYGEVENVIGEKVLLPEGP
ncbi:hypothetical protein HK101_005530, partial [Irineochytrium annulatum]